MLLPQRLVVQVPLPLVAGLRVHAETRVQPEQTRKKKYEHGTVKYICNDYLSVRSTILGESIGNMYGICWKVKEGNTSTVASTTIMLVLWGCCRRMGLGKVRDGPSCSQSPVVFLF